jgi:hypothetical protein
MRRMKIGLAVVFSALIVGLLVTGPVASDDMAGETTTVNLTGSWIYEYQDTYVSTGQLHSGNFTMELHQFGNALLGSYVVPATETESEIICPVVGEIYDGDSITLTSICVGDLYVGLSQTIGAVSLNDSISGTYMGSDNTGKVWLGNFTASR